MRKEPTDIFRTLSKPSEGTLLKERKSKFFGYAFPIENEKEVKPIIETLRKKHPTAGHVCYAWQIGHTDIRYRTNDDGEPNNSAGKPIYGQILSYKATNVLVAVARIFGGTKLGVGGLISAYRSASQMVLESAVIVEKTIQQEFRLSFEYADIDKVMRIVKQKQLRIVSQRIQTNCKLVISVRQSQAEQIEGVFGNIPSIEVKRI